MQILPKQIISAWLLCVSGLYSPLSLLWPGWKGFCGTCVFSHNVALVSCRNLEAVKRPTLHGLTRQPGVQGTELLSKPSGWGDCFSVFAHPMVEKKKSPAHVNKGYWERVWTKIDCWWLARQQKKWIKIN